jgi:hypothetical protein
MKTGATDIGWEIASWVIVVFLVWGGLRFFRSAREVHRDKKYVDPTGRVFTDAERRRVVVVHALFGVVALLGAGFAAIGLLFF